jgi:signal transduction histidine kinase
MDAALGIEAHTGRAGHGIWRRLRGAFTARRIGFGLILCLVVSTSVLFQPHFYRLFIFEQVARAWLDYFGECLLMTAPILIALTASEVLTQGRSRLVIASAALFALIVGASVGAALLVWYYDMGWEHLGWPEFVGDVVYWVLIGGGVAMIYGFQQSAASAASTLHRAQIDQVGLAKQMMEARLQVMRAQIEPHFLFNTLANVKRLCQTDVNGGVAMLDNLVRYLRAALPRIREEQSTLGQEGELVQAYLAVLKIRMGTRLHFAVDIPADLFAHPFPPMILLTLAENAIKHGITPSSSGGMISVRAHGDGQRLRIRLADNGVGFGAAATSGTGVGLANTRARLAALHGPTAELSFLVNEPTGVIAVIDMPLLLSTTVQ